MRLFQNFADNFPEIKQAISNGMKILVSVPRTFFWKLKRNLVSSTTDYKDKTAYATCSISSGLF